MTFMDVVGYDSSKKKPTPYSKLHEKYTPEELIFKSIAVCVILGYPTSKRSRYLSTYDESANEFATKHLKLEPRYTPLNKDTITECHKYDSLFAHNERLASPAQARSSADSQPSMVLSSQYPGFSGQAVHSRQRLNGMRKHDCIRLHSKEWKGFFLNPKFISVAPWSMQIC